MKLFSKENDMKFGTARRITTNFISLITSEIISKFLQLVIFVYLARRLGKDDFGVFSFGLAFALIVAVIADFGLNYLFVREISRNKNLASKYLFNGIVVKIFLSIATVFLAYLFLDLMGYSYEVKTVAYIMLFFTLMQSFTELNYAIFRAFERMYYEMGIKISRMLILIVAISYLLRNDYGLVASTLAFPLTELVIFTISTWLVYRRFTKISFEFDYNFSKRILKESSLFFFSIVFTTLYMYVGQIMISKLRSTTEVGVYSAAANIVTALFLIPLIYGNSIYPVISRFYITSKKSLKFAYEKSFKYMFIIGLPIASGLYFLSDDIVLLLYGKEYMVSATILSILSGYLFLKFLNPVTGFTLMAINKQGTRLFSQGMAAIINIILNLILIPIFGIVGAAFATLITEIIFFITYTSVIIKYGFGLKFLQKFAYKPIIAVAVMVSLLSFVENLLLAIVIGAIMYFAVLLSLKIIDKEDKRLYSKVVNNL